MGPGAALCLQAGFTPATHDSGWTHIVSQLQAQCDRLAATGASVASPRSIPFKDLHHDTAVTLRRGVLVLSLADSLDAIYDAAHPAPVHPSADPPVCDAAYLTWSAAVESGSLSPGAMRAAAVLRAASRFPDVPSTVKKKIKKK